MPFGRLKYEVANSLTALPALAEAARAYLARLRLDADDIADLLVILDELASNVVRHAWPDGDDHHFSLELDAALLPDAVLITLRIEDGGLAFDPTRARPDGAGLLDDSRPAGGFGMRLLAALADGMDYHRRNDRNCLSVIKRVALPAAPPSR